MKHAGTALFLEPSGSLRDRLIERKAWLEKVMPGQAYVSHPPHCTILFGNYGPPTAWLDTLRIAASQVAPFEVATTGWQQFPRDLLAGGGHTVAFRAELGPRLAHLQRQLATALAPFRQVGEDRHPLADTEPFAASLRSYGFPFVGPHWIPHFTIASPLVAPESSLLEDLMSGPVEHRFPLRSVSLWRVHGDRHERLRELALGQPQT